jgi:putative membrane protein
VGASFLRLLIVAALVASRGIACASSDPGAAAGAETHGHFGDVVTILLAVSAALYVRGILVLWGKAGVDRGVRTSQVGCFVLGWLALAAVLLSPIDALAGRSFGLHMIEHELLMVVAAPLFVLARPLQALTWALPRRARRAFAAVVRAPLVRASWRTIGEPLPAWGLHALAIGVWHLPVLFVAALASEPLHVLQHLCFFASALAFWWAVFGSGARAPGALSIAMLFTTMLYTGALGALLTFAPTPWYVTAAEPRLWGLTALEDQQLGGLIMWVPGSLAYLIACLAIVGAWLSVPRMQRVP